MIFIAECIVQLARIYEPDVGEMNLIPEEYNLFRFVEMVYHHELIFH